MLEIDFSLVSQGKADRENLSSFGKRTFWLKVPHPSAPRQKALNSD